MLRRITSLTLLVTWIITLVTGTSLLLSGTKTLYWLAPIDPSTAAMLHTYVSYIMSGAIVVHLYLNWSALKSYIKPRRR